MVLVSAASAGKELESKRDDDIWLELVEDVRTATENVEEPVAGDEDEDCVNETELGEVLAVDFVDV